MRPFAPRSGDARSVNQSKRLAVTPWRFVVLGILILLFRRLPFVVGLTKAIPVFATWRESAFSGCTPSSIRFTCELALTRCECSLSPFSWFGPIGAHLLMACSFIVCSADDPFYVIRSGVSAVYYIETALRVLPDDEAHARLRNTIGPVVYFVIFSSVLVSFPSAPGRMRLSAGFG